MDSRQLQIPLPKNWQDFEDLIQALFKAIWEDPVTQKNGRLGQPQHGVDVYGSPKGDYGRHRGVQCKGKDQAFGKAATIGELHKELGKAEGFDPPLEHWFFATTAPVDEAMQTEARRLSAERGPLGKFAVTTLGWQEIQVLLCDHPEVLAQFYPNLALDVPGLLRQLEALVGAAANSAEAQPEAPIWLPVSFAERRDLGPALLGRSLGPADAASCPRLDEADAAVAELEQAYAVRLIGEPGAGKSICAYQVAQTFAERGWNVRRLLDPRLTGFELAPDGARTIFIIDDAHLANPGALRRAEDAAGPDRLLLTTHTSVGTDHASRGAIAVDPKRAVSKIAAELRRDPRLIEVVRRIDDHVGESIGEEDLRLRIDEAERTAGYPWQFSFILGGGWRRAEQAATKARLAGADLALAATAIRQLASRDARPELSQLLEVTRAAGIADESGVKALGWLAEERLLIGPGDLRCPHQRFAGVVLPKILAGLDEGGRAQVASMLRHTLADPAHPLSGLNVLLSEVCFGERRWCHLVRPEALAPLIARCWAADTAGARNDACLVFAALDGFLPDWPASLLSGREAEVSGWLSNPEGRSGSGLARLMHAIWGRDDAMAEAILDGSDPRALAAAVSAATSETAYELGEIASAIRPLRDVPWAAGYRAALDRPALKRLAGAWSADQPLFPLINLCKAVVWADEALGLDMVEALLPLAKAQLAADPVESFHGLQEIAWHVLRVFDPLGAYEASYPPGERHRKLAVEMVDDLSAEPLAAKLSQARLRQFQQVTFLLSFVADVRPALFNDTVAALDWTQIAATIGPEWSHLPHDVEVLFGVAYGAPGSEQAIEAIVSANLDRVAVLPARLALVAPEAARAFVAAGGVVGIGRGGFVKWGYGAVLVTSYAELNPELLGPLLRPSGPAISLALAKRHPSAYSEAAPFLAALRDNAPDFLQDALGDVEPQAAEVGWKAALGATGGARDAARILVEVSLARPDAIGDVARRLEADLAAQATL